MRRFKRRSYGTRRKRRATAWGGQGYTAAVFDGAVGPVKHFDPLTATANGFVIENSRFAVQNDVITYLRIVGELRYGLYFDGTAVSPEDCIVNYGLVLVKGEYDNSGNWSVAVNDIPSPSLIQDTADKWLFRRSIVLSPGENIYEAGAGPPVTQVSYMNREAIMSTDSIGPLYSHLDLKPKRRAQFEEKLGIVTEIAQINANYELSLVHNLRILTARWG